MKITVYELVIYPNESVNSFVKQWVLISRETSDKLRNKKQLFIHLHTKKAA